MIYVSLLIKRSFDNNVDHITNIELDNFNYPKNKDELISIQKELDRIYNSEETLVILGKANITILGIIQL
jgi:hypothetical protein